MERFLWVCLGGAVGTGSRYLVALWAQERFGAAFPWGTFLVNVVGCFFIGLLMELGLLMTSFPLTLRVALTTGVLGGLTTYSSFTWETTRLFQEGARTSALLNFALTTVAGFTAAALGLWLARLLVKA
jgi:CrcB protein